jgi:hypothetical protein
VAKEREELHAYLFYPLCQFNVKENAVQCQGEWFREMVCTLWLCTSVPLPANRLVTILTELPNLHTDNIGIYLPSLCNDLLKVLGLL